MPVPTSLKVLCLNNDYTPLNIIGWKRAIKRLFTSPCIHCGELGYKYENGIKMKCQQCDGSGTLPPALPVEYYHKGYFVRDSRGHEHVIPAVILNPHYIHRKHKKVPFSRINVLRRDAFRCQYCGEKLHPQLLTIDHVVPRSMWNGNTSPTCWKNLVTACKKCNTKKANRTPEQANMPLKKLVNGRWIQYKKPKQPTSQEISLGLTYRKIPSEWKIYVEPFRKSSVV